ncbi:MAG: beta-mannosidase [Bacteroidales bacterium]|nr:beta-mannosidase [Candidatus Physcousia equi]
MKLPHSVISMLCGCTVVVSSCTVPLDKYVNELHQSAAAGIMYGHHDDLLYGCKEGLDASDTYLVCGQYPALLSLELTGIERGAPLYWGAIPFDSLRAAIVAQHEQGGYVTVSWHARNPSTGGAYNDLSVPDVVGRILKGQNKESETFNAYMDRLALFFNSLRDSRGKAIPIIFRPWHENHGSWFWWGKDFCSAEEYKALYRLTAKSLKSRGVKHLLYAYSPGSYFTGTEDYLQRYPGDDIISILGFEAYISDRASNMTVEQTRSEFIARVQRNLSIVDSIAKQRDKVIAITESGFKPNYDSQWWTKAILPAIEGYAPCYINLWSNHWTGSIPAWSTYPGEESEADFKVFSKSAKVRMRNRRAN